MIETSVMKELNGSCPEAYTEPSQNLYSQKAVLDVWLDFECLWLPINI